MTPLTGQAVMSTTKTKGSKVMILPLIHSPIVEGVAALTFGTATATVHICVATRTIGG